MGESFDLDAPDRFTAGAVGVPGERVFYLQAHESGALVTLKIEKEHFLRLIREFPEMGIEVMRELADRLSRTTAELSQARSELKKKR